MQEPIRRNNLADCRHIKDERLPKVKRLFFFCFFFLKHFRIRIFDLQEYYQCYRDQRRNPQHCEADPVRREQVIRSLNYADDKKHDRT